jgi:hypothetical protein
MRTAVLGRNRCPFIGIAVIWPDSLYQGARLIFETSPVGFRVIDIPMRDLFGHDFSMLQGDYLR